MLRIICGKLVDSFLSSLTILLIKTLSRVATNISATLEVVLAQDANCHVDQVFTFASATMNIVAVALTSKGLPVHLYLGKETAPFDDEQLATLALLGGNIKIFSR